MKQHIAQLALVVDDYDEAIAFYTQKLRFTLVEDTVMSATKRWVVVAPPGVDSPGVDSPGVDSPGVDSPGVDSSGVDWSGEFTTAGCRLLLAKAASDEQRTRIGNQTGGRVFLFLHTDDFERDYQNLLDQGIPIVRERSVASYGTVAVFQDLYGNLWDLIEPISHD